MQGLLCWAAFAIQPELAVFSFWECPLTLMMKRMGRPHQVSCRWKFSIRVPTQYHYYVKLAKVNMRYYIYLYIKLTSEVASPTMLAPANVPITVERWIGSAAQVGYLGRLWRTWYMGRLYLEMFLWNGQCLRSWVYDIPMLEYGTWVGYVMKYLL